jgi:hypothetical protein
LRDNQLISTLPAFAFVPSFFRENIPTSEFGMIGGVQHVTGTGSGLLGGIPRVVVQISALTLKGPL